MHHSLGHNNKSVSKRKPASLLPGKIKNEKGVLQLLQKYKIINISNNLRRHSISYSL